MPMPDWLREARAKIVCPHGRPAADRDFFCPDCVGDPEWDRKAHIIEAQKVREFNERLDRARRERRSSDPELAALLASEAARDNGTANMGEYRPWERVRDAGHGSCWDEE